MPATAHPTETPGSQARTTEAVQTVGADAAPAVPDPLALCRHEPRCPSPDANDRYRAHVLVSHPEQGWSLLCNGVIVFDDLGALLPGHGYLPAQCR
jgi:Family of unknown function (DUF5999)